MSHTYGSWAARNLKERGTQMNDPRWLLTAIPVLYKESTQRHHSSDKAITTLSDLVKSWPHAQLL